MQPEQILSVGIDIGTSTTQVVFSRLTVADTAGFCSVPRVSIVDKQLVYQGEIHPTPLVDRVHLDGTKIQALVAGEFARAGVTPDDTHTGAVIITGEAARKENAALVLEKLSRFAGEFVVSTAGPDLESILAGKGSGAQQYARDSGCYTANLDIGGGTSNLVLFDPEGCPAAKGCVDIGGRQIRLAQDWTVTECSPSARRIAERLGVPLQVGRPIAPAEAERICQEMAALLERLTAGEDSAPLRAVQTAGSTWFQPPRPAQAVCFSGGVADCVYHSGRGALEYGDIGVLLGQAIRSGGLFRRFHVVDARQTIRATVVGAGSYTTSVSGSTITYDIHQLPQKNLPVLKLSREEQEPCFRGVWAPLSRSVTWFMEQSGRRRVLLALPGKGDPSYAELQGLAQALARMLEQVYRPEEPLFLAVERDIAKALGQLLRRDCPGRPLVVLDGVSLEQGDYLDMGRPVAGGLAIPVVVKTLIFG